MLETIGNLFKVLFFFINLWHERDEKKAAEKKEIADEIIDAFKQTDKKERASKLNAAVGRIKRM